MTSQTPGGALSTKLRELTESRSQSHLQGSNLTSVLHTVRISNADSVLYDDKARVLFFSSERNMSKMQSACHERWTKTKSESHARDMFITTHFIFFDMFHKDCDQLGIKVLLSFRKSQNSCEANIKKHDETHKKYNGAVLVFGIRNVKFVLTNINSNRVLINIYSSYNKCNATQ